MRWRLALLVGPLLLSACAARVAPPAEPPATDVLGAAPVCEASGAVVVACERGAGQCLLVADNERRGALFEFEIAGRQLRGQRPVPLRDAGGATGIKDAEGLAGVGARVFVVGSHSRRSWDKRAPRCTLDADRLAFGLFARDGDALVGRVTRTALAEWQRLLAPAACSRELIVPGAAAQPSAARLCAEIAAGQAAAEHTREDCARGINVEGVAAIGAGDAARVWFGLRGPRLDGRAVLLRLAPGDALRFDAVATVDLGGDGVRDLAVAGDWLWILSGPSADLMQNGVLWRVPLGAVQDGAALRAARVIAALPPFSEAIAFDASGGAFLLVDGDEENGPGAPNGCPTPSRYLYLDAALLR
ncbi:MAG: DUF3616 domain-containing protein [Deltaproteobacteria bacterium]|nr:DUF3616 domain-containing protein [Deltaproteobacteria bacterium]